jgi:hypothetical protein
MVALPIKRSPFALTHEVTGDFSVRDVKFLLVHLAESTQHRYGG